MRCSLLALVLAVVGCSDGRTYAITVTPSPQAEALATSIVVVLIRSDNGARQSTEFPLSSPPSPWMLSFTGVTWPSDAPFEADAEARDGSIVVAAGQGMPKGEAITIMLADIPVFLGTDLSVPPEDQQD